MQVAYLLGSCKEKLQIRIAKMEGNSSRWELICDDNFSLRECKDLSASVDQEAMEELRPYTKKSFPLLSVDLDDAYDVLRALSKTGRIFYKNRKLIGDFFKAADLLYRCEVEGGEYQLDLCLKWGEKKLALKDCDLWIPSEPPCFVQGIVLKSLCEDVHPKWWKISSEEYSRSISIEEVQKIYEQSIDGHIGFGPYLEGFSQVLDQDTSSHSLHSQPILQLKDRQGSFAQFILRYKEKEYPLSLLRDPVLEKEMQNMEADLLETDFEKKTLGSSEFYCPLDKVKQSISFLLECGWLVRDYEGKNVLLCEDEEIYADLSRDKIVLKGRIKYGEYDCSVRELVGAVNQRESFVNLGSGNVGLLPDSTRKWQGLATMEMQVEGEKLVFPNKKVGSLNTFFQELPETNFGEDLQLLREKAQDFKSLTHLPPSPNFKGDLRPYQQEGVNWFGYLEHFDFNGILADDMGLGKTVQVIAFYSTQKYDKVSLIVVPRSLLFHWKGEFERFLPSCKVHVHHGAQRFNSPEEFANYSVVITSYSLLRNDVELFSSLPLSLLVLDEAQQIKNPNTKVFKAICRLDAQRKLTLSGTVIENSVVDLWAQFRFLMPELLGEKEAFEALSLSAQSDFRYQEQIRKTVRPFFLRRKKEEVAKDLPEKVEQCILLEMQEGQRRLYEQFLATYRSGLMKKVSSHGASKHRMEIFEAILRLRQICCHPLLVSQLGEVEEAESAKLDLLMKDLSSIIASDSKVLVFSQFTSMLDLISKELREKDYSFLRLDGSSNNRQELVDSFQNDPEKQVMLLSLKAGGVGLNLTKADYVILFDPWWNQSAENQAIDRAHRIGREGTVFARRYILADSIEEKIMKIKEKKSALVEDFLEGHESISSLSEKDLEFLFS